MSDLNIWNDPPLTGDDQAVIDAYQRAGRTVDDLPYSPEFDRMIRELGVADTAAERRRVLRQLLALRKSGRLPRVEKSVSEV